MGMYEFFFPEQAEANHLRSMAASMRASSRKSGYTRKKVSQLEDRIGELEDDVDFMSMITLSLFGILHEKGLVDRQSLIKKIDEVDMMDGRKDGKISPEALRKAFGFIA